MRRAVELFGWDDADLLDATKTAVEATFLPLPERERLLADVILPGYKV
jgi:adenosine deaminase